VLVVVLEEVLCPQPVVVPVTCEKVGDVLAADHDDPPPPPPADCWEPLQ
jgi:hypothetical protein